MHPLAYDHLKRVLMDRKVIGPDDTCEYYPCHFMGQDCTWCFCPFYPCEDVQTGGEWVQMKTGGLIWSCSDCFWLHTPEVAAELMTEFQKLGIDGVESLETRKEELNSIFIRLKERYSPKPRK